MIEGTLLMAVKIARGRRRRTGSTAGRKEHNKQGTDEKLKNYCTAE